LAAWALSYSLALADLRDQCRLTLNVPYSVPGLHGTRRLEHRSSYPIVRVRIIAAAVTVLASRHDGTLARFLIADLASFAVVGTLTGLQTFAEGRLSASIPPPHANEFASTLRSNFCCGACGGLSTGVTARSIFCAWRSSSQSFSRQGHEPRSLPWRSAL
jgi:hypothetical protein